MKYSIRYSDALRVEWLVQVRETDSYVYILARRTMDTGDGRRGTWHRKNDIRSELLTGWLDPNYDSLHINYRELEEDSEEFDQILIELL